MECTIVRELLVAYIQGEIEESKSILAHLANCETCAKEERQIRAHLALYDSLPPFMPISDLWPGLRAQIEADLAGSHRSQPAHPFSWRSLSLGFAAALLLLVTFIQFPWLQMGARIPSDIVADANWKTLQGAWAGILSPGQRFQTSSDCLAQGLLSPGIHLHLALDTSMVVIAPQTIFLTRGAVLAQVQPGQSLLVRTDFGEAQVQGTVFSLALESYRALLQVFEGTVRFRNVRGQEVGQTGMSLCIPKGNPPEPPQKLVSLRLPWWAESSLRLTLESPQASYSLGQQPTITFTLTNVSGHPVKIQSFSRKRPHFLLAIARGALSYDIPLKPSETVEEIPLLTLAHREHYRVHGDLTAELKETGSYCLTGIYQVAEEIEGVWQGVLASEPLSLEITR